MSLLPSFPPSLLPQVQESVASCLPPLVPAIKEDAAGIVRNLLQLLLESDKYAERKGAAYGLAGLVKGLGILSLKQQEIMTTLTDAIQDKKNFRRREGWFEQISVGVCYFMKLLWEMMMGRVVCVLLYLWWIDDLLSTQGRCLPLRCCATCWGSCLSRTWSTFYHTCCSALEMETRM